MKFYLFLLLLTSFGILQAQSTGERVKENAKWKTENKLNEKVDRAIDDVLDGNIFKRRNKKNNAETADEKAKDMHEGDKGKSGAGNGNNQTTAGGNAPQQTSSFAAYSKFDFVAGDKILYYDDFEQVAIGDFPVDFNTDASAEVMTVQGKPGKWLSLTKNGSFIPEQIKALPDNFTLEMNVGIIDDPSNNMSGLGLHFNTNQGELFDYHFGRASFVTLHPAGGSATFSVYQPATDNTMGNEFKMPQWNLYADKAFARVSLWRQGGRLRVYINENKLMDIPRFFNKSEPYYLSIFRSFFGECNLLLGDVKFAVGLPDTRNKLITDGKFSTTGILFDFQKANIKPESYGVIKEIATALTENPTVKINIIGHTSNDGDANANLVLSKQRAAAVKQVLITEFGIDATRMETDGKGGSQPVDNSGTAVGKANNRRVEFVKL